MEPWIFVWGVKAKKLAFVTGECRAQVTNPFVNYEKKAFILKFKKKIYAVIHGNLECREKKEQKKERSFGMAVE